jgi:hypothetical protein
VCQVPAGSDDAKDLIVTVANRIDVVRGTLSRVYTYDAPSSTSTIFVRRANGATVGGLTVTITGNDFRSTDRSMSVRVGGTACEVSAWISNTATLCKTPAAVGHYLPVVVTIGDRVSGGIITRVRAFSFDMPSIASVTISDQATWFNMPTTGVASIIVSGSGFGVNQMSVQARIGRTAAMAQAWISDSSVTCKIPVGEGILRSAAVTISRQFGTLTRALTYDLATMSSLSMSNGPALGSCVGGSCVGVTISGRNFVMFDHSLRARVMGTSCETTIWRSETSVVCYAPGGMRVMRDVIISVGIRVNTVSGAFSYGEFVLCENVFWKGIELCVCDCVYVYMSITLGIRV